MTIRWPTLGFARWLASSASEEAGARPSTREPSRAAAGISAASRRRTAPLAINRLPSGPTIDLSRACDTRLEDLPRQQLRDLSESLGMLGDMPWAQQLEYVRRQLTLDPPDWIGMTRRFDAYAAMARSGLVAQLMQDQVFGAQTEAVCERLCPLARRARCSVHEIPVDAPQGRLLAMNFAFGGTDLKRSHLAQDLQVVLGGVGPVMRAARELAALVAEVLERQPHRYVNRIAGLSMGGGVAQAFAAALQSRTSLSRPPALVLLDPVLLNDAQARHATHGGVQPCDFEGLRGVAITLDDPQRPRRGVMNLMKGLGGYASPGLVQLRLGLRQGDGPGSDGRPHCEGPLGYHSNRHQYRRALGRLLTPASP